MQKVKDFVANTTDGVRLAPKYLVRPAADAKTPPYWPTVNLGAKPAPSQMPIQPNLAGQSYPVQIRSVLVNHYRYTGKIPSRASLDRQVKRLTVHYKDLRGLGFDIKDVTTFGLRHAKALLANWQANRCATTTIYPRWSMLRTWSRALGKHRMLGTLSELLPGFERKPELGSTYLVLTLEQLTDRSAYLESKSDLTAYFVDRLCRELRLTREEALQVELDAVKTVVEGDANFLRIGIGNGRTSVQNIRVHLPLLTQMRDFMVSRNRKTLAWSNLGLDAALQKYTLRLSYVTRTLFPEEKRGAKAVTKEGDAP